MKALHIDDPAILRVLHEQYGLSGALSPLVSERDYNLLLVAVDGQRYIVKISAAEEPAAVAAMQAEALVHIEKRGFSAGAPTMTRTLAGDMLTSIEHQGQQHFFRVVSYVSGMPMSATTGTPALAASLGQVLAGLGKALQGFDHEGQHQHLFWDMQRATDMWDKTSCIADAGLRSRVAAVFEEFGRLALPRFPTLRRQVIHNDANPDNVMVDDDGQRVTGIIDFGDMIEAPLLVDVAVAAAYLRNASDPLSLIIPFVAAYHESAPLTEEELGLLYLLIRTRIATTVTMCYWRAVSYAGDDDYLQFQMETERDAEDFLAALEACGADEFHQKLKKAL